MNTEFSEIEVWFTDQNNNALEIEDNVNISLIINTSVIMQKRIFWLMVLLEQLMLLMLLD